MASKKQRRRREKERRHEYETVYVDDEGQEVEVDETEAPRKKESRKAAPDAKSSGTKTVEPPSWNRVARRAAIFAPIMLVVLYLVRPKGTSPVASAVQAAFIVVLLVPFMYMMDSIMYRSYQKRMAKRGGSPPKPK